MNRIRDLLRFQGSIGRGQFWLILLLGELPALIPLPGPFVVRRLSFPLAGVLGGEAHMGYVRAEGVASGTAWFLLSAYAVAQLCMIWLLAATMTKRLHERGRSGKWLALFVIGLSATIGFSFLLSRTDVRFILLDIANLIFFAGVCGFGAWLMLEMAYLPGDKFFSPNNSSESDLRRAK